MTRIGAAARLAALALPLLAAACHAATAVDPGVSPGVVLRPEDSAALYGPLAGRIEAAPEAAMAGPGVAGARGGVHVKFLRGGEHEVMLPLPQRAAGQVPLSYALRCVPAGAAGEIRLRTREGGDEVVTVLVRGEREQEVHLEWAAAVLLSGGEERADGPEAERFLAASACAQADDEMVRRLAEGLWGEAGGAVPYARGIQGFIANMRRTKPPRALDALGILASGANGICTANANLAAALLRAKGIPARSLAVIPTISRSLEMHRIVAFAQDGGWVRFDPSSVHADIPMRAWHSVVMATTSPADEAISMTPRMGAMFGCPYGQEAEFLDAGLTLWGQDFFRTEARPLAEFEVDAATATQAGEAWESFLRDGRLPRGSLRAHEATDAEKLSRLLDGDEP